MTATTRVRAPSNPNTSSTSTVSVAYQAIRNMTSPDEKSNGVQTFFANIPARELLKFDTTGNLRNYIPELKQKKRNQVHMAIAATIRNAPDRFINLNSGATLVASAIDVDDHQKMARVKNGTIINGAQTRGEIERYFDELEDQSQSDDFYVRLEIIIDPDDSRVIETAIARNTSTTVQSITQAGARGQLDELEESYRRVYEGANLRKSETDDEVEDSQRIIQLARLVMPTILLGDKADIASEKLRAYKNRAQCLKDFTDWQMHAQLVRKGDKEADKQQAAKYEFMVEIAPWAMKEYEYWRHHEGWQGLRLREKTKSGKRAITRNRTSGQITVADGIIFPVVGAMAEFVEKDSKKGWCIKRQNSILSDQEIIDAAVGIFRNETHHSDPMLMGRSETAYDALRLLTGMASRMSKRFSSSNN